MLGKSDARDLLFTSLAFTKLEGRSPLCLSSLAFLPTANPSACCFKAVGICKPFKCQPQKTEKQRRWLYNQRQPVCWYWLAFSWLELGVPSDMITGLFSFSCTLCVACACLSVSCLAQEALPSAVPKLIVLHRSEERPGTFIGESASFNLSCTAVNHSLAGSRRGRRGKGWLWPLGSGMGTPGLSSKGPWVRWPEDTNICVGNSVHQAPLSEEELRKMFSLSPLPHVSFRLCPAVKYCVNPGWETWCSASCPLDGQEYDEWAGCSMQLGG